MSIQRLPIAISFSIAAIATSSRGQDLPMPAPTPATIRTIDDLVALSGPQLDALYRQGEAGSIPAGKVRGRALYPDAKFPKLKSDAARVAWQGKVFRPESNTAVNRFFGARIVRGDVAYGPSWLDGQPSIILDYEQTSRIYRPYRDEIRQIGPGLYLGLMYDRRSSPPGMKMYFAFEE